jgi:hypothetical protein
VLTTGFYLFPIWNAPPNPESDLAEGTYALPRRLRFRRRRPTRPFTTHSTAKRPPPRAGPYTGAAIDIEKSCVLKFFASKAGMDDSDVVTRAT